MCSAFTAERVVVEVHAERLLDDRIDAGIGHAGAQRDLALGHAQHRELHALADMAGADRLTVIVQRGDHVGEAGMAGAESPFR